MINRTAVVLCYKQPFVDWINTIDFSPDAKAPRVSLAEANGDNNVYLVEVEDQEELSKWLKPNCRGLFEEELHSWYTDQTLWPRDRSLTLFNKWCSCRLHTMVFDTGGSQPEDDET